MLGAMQWHWGNIGSAAAGIGALIAALFAVYGVIRYGPPWLRDSRQRLQAQAAAARQQETLAREQAEQILLDRRRRLEGWSSGAVAAYTVALVTSGGEMNEARDQLVADNVPCSYVILRVDEGNGSFNRAAQLRQLIDAQGTVARAPTDGEREALETGLDAMGIPWAGHRKAPAPAQPAKG